MKTAVTLALALLATAAHADPAGPGGAPGETPARVELAPQPVPAPQAPPLEQFAPPPHARTEAWIATGVTAALVGMSVFSVVRARQESDRANEILHANGDPGDWNAAQQSTDRWFHATLLFGGLTVVSAAVTGTLWSRSQPSFRAAVTPQGAYVGYSRSF